MDKVFTHDSKWMTKGVGSWTNNPGNIRCLKNNNPYKGECVKSKNNNGWFEKFPTIEQGIYANTELYVRKYMGLSADQITWKWARAKSGSYYSALRSCYQ